MVGKTKTLFGIISMDQDSLQVPVLVTDEVLSVVDTCVFLPVPAALASPQQFSCQNCGEEFKSRIAAQAHKQYVCKRSEDTDSSHTSSVQLLQDLGNRYQTSSPFLNIKTER